MDASEREQASGDRVADAQAEPFSTDARMRLLLKQVPAVLWTTDTDLRVTTIAGREGAALGMTAGRIVGANLADAVDEHPGLVGVMAAHYRALEGQQAFYDARVGERDFHGTVEPLREEAGRIVGCVGA